MIPLSRASQHAIRTLTYLSQQPRDQYCLTRSVAEVLGIPPPFLSKVLQPLVARGILASQRGRAGGVRLARRPGEISLFEVVEAIEHIGTSPECFLGQYVCDDELPCPLHEYWKVARSRHMEELMLTTVADLARYCTLEPRSGYPYPGESVGQLPLPARDRSQPDDGHS